MRALLGIVFATAMAACAQTSAPPARYDDMFGVWSPDGQSIAFTSTRSGDPEIYVARRDGSRMRRLTNTPGRDAHPFFTPDGRTILFQSPRNGSDVRIFAMDVDGSNQRELAATTGFCGVPTPSPDGARIAFMCSASMQAPGSVEAPWRLYLMNRDGSGLHAITDGPGNDQVANWFPDSARLVFWSDRNGRDHIYSLDLASGAVAQLTDGPHDNIGALYTPDGRSIHFISNRTGDDEWALYTMPAGGGEPRLVAAMPSRFGIAYLSPDGREAIIGAPTDAGARLARLDLRTGAPTEIDFR